MADHPELVAEIPKVEKMTVQERLEYAKKRRSQQLKRWERNKDLDSDPPPKKKARKPYKARFEPGVMLLESSSRGDSFEVRKLLETGVDPNLGNDDGLTALHQACIDDNEDIVELLLRFGANVDSVDKELWTPLHAAAACGNIDAVEYLVDQGANIVSINADGNIPLDLVEEDEDLKKFLKEEMDAEGYTEEKLEELRQATEMRMLEDIKLKVENDDDLDQKDHLGATPLHIGSANGYDEVVEYLLENGADIEAEDNDGWQPIHAAACWGQERVIELLVIHGADLEVRTPEGETPYDLCEDPDVRAYIKELKKQVKTNKLMLKESRKKRRNSRTLSVKRTSLKEKITISQNEAKAEAILRQHPQLAFLIPNANKITNGESQAEANTFKKPEVDTKLISDDHSETNQVRSKSSNDTEPDYNSKPELNNYHSDHKRAKLDSFSKEETHPKRLELESGSIESLSNREQPISSVTSVKIKAQDSSNVSSKDSKTSNQGRPETKSVGSIPDHPPPRRPTLPSSDKTSKTYDISNEKTSKPDEVVASPSVSSSQSGTVTVSSVSSSSRSTTKVNTREASQSQQNEVETSKSVVSNQRAKGRELPTIVSKGVTQKSSNERSSGVDKQEPQELSAPRSGSISHSVFESLDTSTSGYPESFHSRRGTGDKPLVTHAERNALQDAGKTNTTGYNSRVTAESGEKKLLTEPKEPSPSVHKKRQAPPPPVKEQKIPHPKDNNATSVGDVKISTDKMAARYTRNEEQENKTDLTKDNNITSEATNNKTPANDQVKIVRQKKSCCAVM